jgi:hypothetical protein
VKKRKKVLLSFEIDSLTNSIVNKAMGLIKEPEGVDFIINSRPLTKKEQEALSKFIREDKVKRVRLLAKKRAAKRVTSTKKRAIA